MKENWPVLLSAFGMVLTLVLAIWGITERNTTRLIEQIDKRLAERDEKLLAKLDSLRSDLKGDIGVLRSDVGNLTGKVERLENAIFKPALPRGGD